MIITYDPGRPSGEIAACDWSAFRWTKKHDTYIIHYLWEHLVKHVDTSFDDLGDILKAHYKDRHAEGIKSSADIYFDTSTIEITNKGVLPNILIQKITEASASQK